MQIKLYISRYLIKSVIQKKYNHVIFCTLIFTYRYTDCRIEFNNYWIGSSCQFWGVNKFTVSPTNNNFFIKCKFSSKT